MQESPKLGTYTYSDSKEIQHPERNPRTNLDHSTTDFFRESSESTSQPRTLFNNQSYLIINPPI
jgi:hypothetical protein